MSTTASADAADRKTTASPRSAARKPGKAKKPMEPEEPIEPGAFAVSVSIPPQNLPAPLDTLYGERVNVLSTSIDPKEARDKVLVERVLVLAADVNPVPNCQGVRRARADLVTLLLHPADALKVRAAESRGSSFRLALSKPR
jgi:hypothetical protein